METWKLGARLRHTCDVLLGECQSTFYLEETVEILDPIGEHSTSLALSRLIGAEYGDVLWYAHAVDVWRESTGHYRLADAIELGDPRMRAAAARLSANQKQEIEARYHELQRAAR